jgi:8-oxo-dGTP diphosphatase
MTQRIDVAVGMLRRSDGAVLMASRPIGKPYAGYWEFPGGKCEPNEDAVQALRRELAEELGISVNDTSFAWVLEHNYPHADVRLHFHWVTDWESAPRALEHQQLLWVGHQDAWPYPVLPATVPLLTRVREELRA